MGGFTCCVPGCYKNSLKHKGTSFHVFPKDTKLRQKWVRQINRVGQRGKFSQFVPTTGHKVCGDHFEGGRKSYMVRVPTIFPLKQKTVKSRPLIRMKPGDATHSQQPDSPAPSHEASCDDGLTNSNGEEPVEVQQDLFAEHSYAYDKGDEREVVNRLKDSVTQLEEKLEEANATIAALRQQLEDSKKSNGETMKFCNTLQQKNRFGVSTSTVSRIWITWLDFLNNKLRRVPIWMPSQLCDKYRPQVFLAKGYDTVDGIMDCTEIFIETPSPFRVQNLAPGRLSDKALTNSCNVLDKFSPGRSIMADRGFTIQDECKARSLHLNIPPVMDGRPQLSEKDEEETRRIARSPASTLVAVC
ncbi:uncharacterized protein LOC125946377 [Dermacentor silvarum]|uniref:uncharacterized protein LOC125946377 n=1 Tax=Dermacentor silvarum TaxID=543639 RepID=UPI002100D1F9|nr:uncharacterized protein LOC125946377 [Dermacentor silvarum]